MSDDTPSDSTSGTPLRGWDAATWRMSAGDPTMRSPIGGIVLLERPPDVAKLVERVDYMSRWFPMLRERLVEPVGPLGSPRLVVDPHFDASIHMTRVVLPAPGSWQQMLAFARRQSLLDLDRDRPLWRATLVEGLQGGRAAIVVVVHHAVADGQGMVMLMAGLFDIEESPDGPAEPMPPAPEPGHTDPLNVTLAALSDAAKRAGGAWAKVVTKAPGLALKAVKRPDKAIGGAVVLGASAVRTTAVHRAPLSPVMSGRGTAYTISTLDLPFPELRAAGKDRGGSVNDAFLAGVAGAARIYHERHGQPVAKLRFNMPISLRRPGEAVSNAVTIARFELPVDIKDPDERVKAMRAVSVGARKEPALYFADVLADASRLLPVQVVAEVAKTSDITTSNVPGPPVPLWVAGAATERVYPLVPTIGAAVNITLLSYAKQLAAMCVATDDAAVPDSQVFLECLVEGFAEIGVHAVENATDPLA